jgi:hypothetical protein
MPTVRQLRSALLQLAHIDRDGASCWCSEGPCAVHSPECAEIRGLLQMGPLASRGGLPVDGRFPPRPVPADVQDFLDLDEGEGA